MTTLQGGISQDNFIGGGIGGSTPWGMIAQAIEKKKDDIKQGFSDFSNTMNNNALASSMQNFSFNPSMTPIQGAGFIQPQQHYGLYNYLTR